MRALILAVFLFAVTAASAQTDGVRTRDERREKRELKMARRANTVTKKQVEHGDRPSYNSLLKSTDYALMYSEGLRYYSTRKPGKKETSRTNLHRAQTLLDKAYQSQRFAGTPQQDSLMYYLGASFYKAGDFTVSGAAFDRFRRDFPMSVFIEDAEYMYAMGFYFSSPEPEYDQTTTMRAIGAIAEYLGRYPETSKKKECEERTQDLYRKLYAKSFENAKLYYDIRQYKAAVMALNNAIDEYPTSPYREELMYLATRSAWLFARNSVASQMTDRYLSMMDNYYNLISEYPRTEHLRDVENMRDEAQKHITQHTQQDGD